MNWQGIRNLTHVQIGAFLALMLVAMQPLFGPRLPSALLLVLGAWLLWKERRALYAARAQRRWLRLWLLLFVPVAISVPMSYDVRTSASVAGALLLFYFAGAALVRALRGDAERRWLAVWVTAMLVFWVVDGYVQYVFGKDLFGIALGPDKRVLGPFAGNLRMPILLVFLMPLMLWLLLPRTALGALGAYLATAVVVMLCGARTVLVYLGILAVGLYARLPRLRWKLPAALAAVVLLAVAIGLSPALKERVARVAELRTPSFETVNDFLSQRLVIWDTATNMALGRPLTGVGAGAFAHAYERYSTHPGDIFRGGEVEAFHAHQLYIGMAAETGLPGLAALIAIFALCVKWYFAAAPARRDQAWPYALGLLTYAFPLNTQSPLFMLWLFPVILLLATGLLAALDEPEAPGAPAAKPV